MSVVLLILTGAVLLTPLTSRTWRRQRDTFDPYVFFVIVYGVMFVGRPLYMIGSGNYTYVTPLAVTDVRRGLDKMLFIALLGAVGFVVGYFLPFTRNRSASRRKHHVWNLKVAARAAAVCGAVGASALIAVLFYAGGWGALDLIFRGRTRGVTAGIESLSFYPWAITLVLIPAGLVLLSLALERRQELLWTAFVIDAIFVGLRAVPVGDRTVLLTFVGSALVVLYLHRNRRPRLLTIVLLAVLAVYISAFLSDLRGRSTRQETVIATAADVVSSPGRVWKRVVSGPDTEMAPVLAAAVSVIPSHEPYTYGMTTGRDLIERPIPRVLWPTKPQSPRVRLISVLWPKDASQGLINPEFSILLYPYWDFGYPGVIVLLAAFGIGARALSEYGRTHADDILGRVLFAVSLWFVLVAVRDTLTETLVRGVFVIGPILAIMRLSLVRQTSGTSRYNGNELAAEDRAADKAEVLTTL